MSYAVHSLFLTHQGEGAHIGRLAVFIRFAGCNLWSGREEDRATAICRFCDTEFVGGRRYADAEALAEAAGALWPDAQAADKFCVLTGGEPMLQVDTALIRALKARSFRTAIETNGTVEPLSSLDWVTVSPKAGTTLATDHADELKLVYPQPGLEPHDFAGFRATHRWLSPMDGAQLRQNVDAAVAYCLRHPEWRLAIQAHKYWRVP
ncbi:MAG TPA: 7-carboxy-7-deazaguanine synthase [Acidisphaera sp.]|nr:7-carboxy-7-deazaguanine synthase [Acidisphaera sp.]